MRRIPMTKLHRYSIIGFLLLAVLALTVSASAAEGKIVVKVNAANVRLKPDINSPVVGKAQMGLILDFLDKSGEWYFVELPPNDKGIAVRGYLHQSVVQEFSDGSPVVQGKPAEKPVAIRKPARVRSSSAPGKKFFVRVGAGYGSKTFSYENSWAFAMYQENAQIIEKYSVDASGVAIDAGFGFMFTPSVGVELSFVPASGKSKGTFTGRFPHPFYFDAFREKTWENGGLKYSGSEINLDVLYAFPVTGRIKAYVMAGGTYFLGVKIQSLKSVTWTETGYPYLDLNVTPNFGEYSASAFGFNAGGGLDYRLSDSLAVNLNARYSSGTAKVKIEAMEVSVPAGGIRATAGIKIGF
jgi:opacity protein-like surface antigen